jgi:uncharacterized membrane protein (DUF4010 family)
VVQLHRWGLPGAFCQMALCRMNEFDLFQRLGLAIAIGALVGAERHWRERDEPAGRRTAGLRTFSLVGMLGGTAGLVERAITSTTVGYPGFVVVGLFLGFVVTITLFMLREAEADKTFSATTAIAAMVTYVLGVSAVLGDMRLAASGGVVLAAILASREVLHGFVRRLTWPELRSALVLLAMTLVVLPLLPSTPVGPFGGISLARVWTLAILLASISFAGYIAAKWLGSARGELLAGAVSGLVSSTAKTVSNARASSNGGDANRLAAGALAAGAVSYGRTVLLVAAVERTLLARLGPALAVGMLAMAACAWYLAQRNDPTGADYAPRNPFDLLAVFRLAALLAIVAFLARAAAEFFGIGGVLVVSALTGLGDVDAVTVTIADMLKSGLAIDTAASAIAIGVASNTFAKAMYGLALGSQRFGLLLAIGSVLGLATATAVYIVAKHLF